MSLLRRLVAWLLALRLLRAKGRSRPPNPQASARHLVEGFEIPRSRRAEGAVALLLLGVGLAGAAFVVVYVSDGSTQLYGLTLGLAFVLLAAALGIAGKRVVPQETRAEPVFIAVDPEEQEAAEERVQVAAEGVTRRRALLGAAGVAGLGLGAALVAPAASLGPNVGNELDKTPWRKGRRLVTEDHRPISADDLAVGDSVTAFPEGIRGERRERLDVPIVLVRLKPEELDLPPDRQGWAVEGILAYSRICTHAGCAVSMLRYPLNEATSHGPALVCPCHYSTFDPRRGARVTFGPAGRPLPQLPLAIDAGRRLVAAGELSDPPGPSWLEAPHRPL